MKYLKKKEKKKRWPIILAVIVVLLVAAAACFFLMPGKTDDPKPETIPTTEETTVAMETEPMYVVPEVTEPIPLLELVNGQIETPYGVLNYPDDLSDLLLIANTNTDPYTLEFYAAMEDKPEVRLFDISFGEGSGGNMGIVKTTQGDVPLNVTIYTLALDESWTKDEIITAQAMQDVINEILDQLMPENKESKSEDPVIAVQPSQNNEVNTLEIETPFCTLYYPGRWGDALRYDHDDSQEGVYKVRFYGKVEDKEVQHLFSIYFGGDEGEQLGAVLSSEEIPVPVNLLMAELKLDGLTDAEIELLCTMQEASNQLIERLPLLQ